LSDFGSVPVQFKVEVKNSADGSINTEVSTITQFRAGLLIPEEDYFVIIINKYLHFEIFYFMILFSN
jgi:hypothetical protein